MPISSQSGGDGSICSKPSDCLYGNCTAGQCVQPLKQCPSECSGNGACTFYDASGNALQTSCTISSIWCTAKCVCNPDFRGLDCSLSSEQLKEISSTRASVCNAIISVINKSNPSAQLLDTVASSLFSIYNPHEIYSAEDSSICFEALTLISQLSQQGYLVGSSASTISILSQTFSNFFIGESAPSLGRRRTQSSGDGSSDIGAVIGNFTSGITSTLANGQSLNIVSDNLQMALGKYPVENMAMLEPSQTEAQLTFGAVPPKIVFGNAAAGEAMNTGGGYSSLGISQYGTNPHPNSNNMTAPIFRLSSDSIPPGTSSSETPVFFITLQFIRELKLTDSSSESSVDSASTSAVTNRTLPECRQYDSSQSIYISCSQCNISSYTNFNVTYICNGLFPSQMQPQDSNSLVSYLNTRHSRALAEESSSGEATEFTSILQSALNKAASILSLNPATIDPRKSMVAIILVGSLGFMIIFVALYLLRWDQFDHHRAIYITKKEEEIKEFKEDLSPSDTTKVDDRKEKIAQNLATTLSTCNPSKPDERDSLFDQAESENNIAQDIDDAIDTSLLESKTFWAFLETVWTDHDYFNVFSESSMATSRFSRWLILCCQILINLFVDTLFFSVFYTDDGSCAAFTSEETCTASINGATSSPVCVWTEDSSVLYGGTCAMAEPPQTVMYSVLVAMACLTFSFPLALLIDALYITIAIYRPDLSAIGFIHPELWLGRSTNIKINESNKDTDEHEVTVPGANASVKERREVDATSHFAFLGKSSVSEEADALTEEAKCFLISKIKCGWFLFNTSSLSDSEQATLGAIVKYMGMNPDHTFIKLPFLQQIYFGSIRKKLEARIRDSRRKQEEINRILESKGDLQVKNKDKLLIQFFVREHFNPFKQYILRFHYGGFFSDATLPLIHPVPWILSWAFIVLSILFFLYWTFAWAVSASGAITPWALNFAILIAQDITVVQFLRVLVVHVLGIVSVRPQLKHIQQVLVKRAMDLVQNGAVTYAADDFSVFQYLSPACRAAQMKVSRELFSGQLLRHIRDVDVNICRKNSDINLALILLMLLSIPLLISLVSEIAGDSVFGTVIGMVCDAFLVVNDYLLSVSVFALIAFYVGLVIHTSRKYLLRPLRSKVNAIVNTLYFRKKKYSQWQQSLRARRRMNALVLIKLFISYAKKVVLKMYNYLFKKEQPKRKVFVTSDSNAIVWKNMNCAIEIHQVTASTNAGRLSLLAILNSKEDLDFSQPGVRKLPTRSSYATTFLNVHALREGEVAGAVPNSEEDSNQRLKEDVDRFTLHSSSHHMVKEYYSSFFQLAQEDSFFFYSRKFIGDGSRSESTDDFPDLDYVIIGLTKHKINISEEIREHSAKKYNPTKLRPLFGDEVEHKDADNGGNYAKPIFGNKIMSPTRRKVRARPRIRIGILGSDSIDGTNVTDKSYDSSGEEEKKDC